MTASSDERLKILQMLEDGKISAEEATTLLRALEKGRSPSPSRGRSNLSGDARFLRVLVTDLDSGQPKVNVTIPIGLVNAGMRMAGRFAPGFDFDMEELEEMLASGAVGKVVEVTDIEDNERVEIYVE